ncbi:MAG: DMT family transporter, partial [Bacteroidia bacterium]|nr:DMT family transporter [Bacteroidia bacterium]
TKYFAISGILGSGVPAFLFTAAQTKIASSLAGALNGLTPLFALLVGVLFLGVQFNKYKLFGVILGLLGAFLLIFHEGVNLQLYHTSLIVLATLCYGINVNIIKHKLGNYPPIFVAAYPLLIVGVLCMIILYFIGFEFKANVSQNIKSFGAIMILSIAGTAISLVLFNKLIQKTTAVFASSVTYLIPIVALFWGFIDHERITFLQVVGLGCILVAIWLIRKEKSVYKEESLIK